MAYSGQWNTNGSNKCRFQAEAVKATMSIPSGLRLSQAGSSVVSQDEEHMEQSQGQPMTDMSMNEK